MLWLVKKYGWYFSFLSSWLLFLLQYFFQVDWSEFDVGPGLKFINIYIQVACTGAKEILHRNFFIYRFIWSTKMCILEYPNPPLVHSWVPTGKLQQNTQQLCLPSLGNFCAIGAIWRTGWISLHEKWWGYKWCAYWCFSSIFLGFATTHYCGSGMLL